MCGRTAPESFLGYAPGCAAGAPLKIVLGLRPRMCGRGSAQDCSWATPPDVRQDSAQDCSWAPPPDVRQDSAQDCSWAPPPDVRQNSAQDCSWAPPPDVRQGCAQDCSWATPPDVRQGSAQDCSWAPPPDVRQGCALPSTIKERRALPLVRPSAWRKGGKARTRGVAQPHYSNNGRAEPCRTSGGRARKTLGQSPKNSRTEPEKLSGRARKTLGQSPKNSRAEPEKLSGKAQNSPAPHPPPKSIPCTLRGSPGIFVTDGILRCSTGVVRVASVATCRGLAPANR
jgi:hypothetical protein